MWQFLIRVKWIATTVERNEAEHVFASARTMHFLYQCSYEALNGWLPQCWFRQSRSAAVRQRRNIQMQQCRNELSIKLIRAEWETTTESKYFVSVLDDFWIRQDYEKSQRCHKDIVQQFFIKTKLTAVEGNWVENTSVSARTNTWITHCRNAGCGHVAMPQWQCR